uniref:Cytochrome b-c1 complex subunit 9 n=1 Tax=Strongyloides venezuelensis TaxID=75913 RepID=A0A0K0G0X4_STRVS
MNSVRNILHIIGSSYLNTFLFGVVGGAGFELFKIKFKFAGFDYYTSFTKLQIPKELEAFEEELKERDYVLMKKYEPEALPKDYPKYI